MEKYIFFIDIDGTLEKNGAISEENVKAIKEARNAGHKVFINTGRSYAHIPEFVFSSTEFDGVVSGVGANIRVGNEEIFSQGINEKTIEEILRRAFVINPVWVYLEGEKRVYHTVKEQMPRKGELLLTKEDFYNKSKGDKISSISASPDSTDVLIGFDDVYVIDHTAYLEVVQKGINKGTAIKKVAEHLGIDADYIVSMGDSLNDIDMFDASGIKVSMSTGVDELKKLADIIADNSEASGVANGIYKIIEGFGKAPILHKAND